MKVLMLLPLIIFLSGCAVIEKARRSDELIQEVANLKQNLEELKKEKERELSELEKAKRQLEQSLAKEIEEYKAKLEMTERGLVITFLSEVFFDSGRDIIRLDGKEVLQRVAPILNDEVPNSYVAIEGHTDNEPIRYSGWKSNWELSSARALAVLHYLIDECKFEPQRLCANGYGEYRPVADNDTPQNKQKNRRVEIVILPEKISKVRESEVYLPKGD